MTPAEPAETRCIAVVLFDGVEELDAVGPWEVLAHWTGEHPEDGWVVTTVAERPGAVTAAKGLRLLPEHTLAEVPAPDVVVMPGGRGTPPLLTQEPFLAWVRERAAAGALMTSVCTGALVYAAAGLLAGRPATTHHANLQELAALDPSVELRPDARFVDDGSVVTAAGVSAGIDMALHLVDRLAGRERAVQVRRGIQYDPQPPV